MKNNCRLIESFFKVKKNGGFFGLKYIFFRFRDIHVFATFANGSIEEGLSRNTQGSHTVLTLPIHVGIGWFLFKIKTCRRGNGTASVIWFLLWWPFLVPSLKNTVLIFLEIFFIEYCTETTCDVITFHVCIIQNRRLMISNQRLLWAAHGWRFPCAFVSKRVCAKPFI